jgi:3-oxosteroid 1-dehydrogenase
MIAKIVAGNLRVQNRMDMSEIYDVVVLGSGIGGLSASLAAHQFGLSSIVLEKAEALGGGTCYSYGLIWVGSNHLAAKAGYTDSEEDVLAYMRFLCGGEGDDDRMQAFLDHAPEMLRFYEAAGVRFRLVEGLTDHYYGIAPGGRQEGRSLEAELIARTELGSFQHKLVLPPTTPWHVTAEEQIRWGGMNRESEWDADLMAERRRLDMRGMGVGLVSQFLKALLDRRIPIETDVTTERLLVEDGTVTGVVLADGRRLLARKGVILATGGYEANPEMVANFERLPGWRSQFPPGVTGDGLVLGAELGAAVRVIQNNMQLFLGIEVPGENNQPSSIHLAGIIELCSPHTVVVNRDGSRFADESYFQGMVQALRSFDIARHDYANLPCYLIFDRRYAEAYSFAGLPSGAPMPSWIARSDTLSGLADQLGIDSVGLSATLERFNVMAEGGVDEDFGRGKAHWKLVRGAGDAGRNPNLGPVSEPPFYGLELHPTGAGAAGLLTDTLSRVMHLRGQPIPGLYAIGNAAAHTEYGTGYQAGLSLASAMTFSYLTAGHLAGTNAEQGIVRGKPPLTRL